MIRRSSSGEVSSASSVSTRSTRLTRKLAGTLVATISGCRTRPRKTSGPDTLISVFSARPIAIILGDCSPRTISRKVTMMKARAIAGASEMAWLAKPVKIGSSRSARAGWPRKPMPSEAIVMPIWLVATNSSTRSSCSSARVDPRTPSSRSCSSRARRERTTANSAATKKLLTAINSSRRTSSRTLIGYGARYFGLGRLQRPFGLPNIAGLPADSREAGILADETMKVATLNEMLEEVVRLGETTGTGDQAHELRGELEGRLATARGAVAGAAARPPVRAPVAGATVPRVIGLERLCEPVRVAGFWVPEMISIAGGEDVAGDPGLAPAQVSWGELAGLRPDVIIVMVEGYLEDAQGQGMEVWEHLERLGADRGLFSPPHS